MEMKTDIKRQTLETKEIAAYLGVSKDLIYQMVREHKIPYVRLGRRILFKRDSIDRWLDNQEMQSLEGGGAS